MPTATAAVLSANHEPFVLQEIEVESPRRDEVLVRIVATGLCHTDLSAREGLIPFPLPGVLGHEGAGVVEEIGDGVTDLAVGDHVVMSFAFCGGCRTCRTGHPVYCESWAGLNLFGGSRADGTPTLHQNGTDLHGHFFGQSSLATRALAPASSVIKVPRRRAAGDARPARLRHADRRAVRAQRPAPRARLHARHLRRRRRRAQRPARRGAPDRCDHRRRRRQPGPARVATRLGAAHVVNAREQDAVEALLEFSGGRGIDRTLEATGVPAVLRQAIDVVAPLGVCGIVGAPAPDADVSMNILTAIVKGSRVVGINQGDAVPRESIPALVELHRQGRFPFDELIRVYAFEEIQQAADDAAAGTVVKPVLRMPDAA